MNCPRCRKGFGTLIHQETEYQFCFSCDAVWLEYSQLLRLLPYNQADKFFHALAASPPADKPLFCPSCKQFSLNRFTYNGISLEGCPICQGVYFDHACIGKKLPDAQDYENYQDLTDAQGAYQFFQSISRLLRSLRSQIEKITSD